MKDKDNLPIPYSEIIGSPDCPHTKMFVDRYYCEQSLICDPDCKYIDKTSRLFAPRYDNTHKGFAGCDYKRLLRDIVEDKIKESSIDDKCD